MSLKWDIRFLKLAHEISQWSKDPSTKVGAIAVGPNREIRSQGYNGFPRGVTDSEERYNDRQLKYRLTVHAEANMCLHAARTGTILEGCMAYVTFPPCSSCAGSLIQAGISEIVTPVVSIPDRWIEELTIADMILKEANIPIRKIEVTL